jgi:FKBP-type peptidyl-prolyl cis-trans isomerase FklB
MSKKIYLFSLVLLALTFTACSETEETGRYDNWRARSEAFIDSIANVYAGQQNGSITVTDKKERLYPFTDLTNGQTIYAKKRISRDGVKDDDKPVYTSKVSAYYRMSYFNGDVVQQNFAGTEPDEFDVPSEFLLNEVISGWGYTLTEMAEGEFWTLYIPYQSGYGSGTGSDGSLQAYSELVYDVKLDKIVER